VYTIHQAEYISKISPVCIPVQMLEDINFGTKKGDKLMIKISKIKSTSSSSSSSDSDPD